MTRIVRFHEVGGPDVLKLEDGPAQEPGPGEVALDVRAIGLNRAEAMFRSGQYLEEPRLPARIGMRRQVRSPPSARTSATSLRSANAPPASPAFR